MRRALAEDRNHMCSASCHDDRLSHSTFLEVKANRNWRVFTTAWARALSALRRFPPAMPIRRLLLLQIEQSDRDRVVCSESGMGRRWQNPPAEYWLSPPSRRLLPRPAAAGSHSLARRLRNAHQLPKRMRSPECKMISMVADPLTRVP